MPRLLRKMVVPTTLPSRRMEAEDALPTTLRARGTEVKPIQEVFDDPATYDHLLPKSWIACPRCGAAPGLQWKSSYTCECIRDDYQFSRHLQEKKHRCVLHCNGNLHFSCTPVNVISRKLREPWSAPAAGQRSHPKSARGLINVNVLISWFAGIGSCLEGMCVSNDIWVHLAVFIEGCAFRRADSHADVSVSCRSHQQFFV